MSGGSFEPYAAPTPIGMRPMHERPPAGRRLTVLMRDGRQLACLATMVYVGDRAGILIYHKRRAIDESKAKGWWPGMGVAMQEVRNGHG